MNVIIWLIVLVLMVVLEGMTAGLATIWFAGGALAAALAAYLNVPVVYQLLIFALVSVVLLIFTRPVAKRLLQKDEVKTNVDSLVGMTALVTEGIDNLGQKGKVRINDIDWLARATKDEIHIPKDSVVKILEVKGVRLIVEETDEKR